MALARPRIEASKFLRRGVFGFLVGLSLGNGSPASASPCEARESLPAELVGIGQDGTFTLADGTRLRLAGVVWPDHLQPLARRALVARLEAALHGQHIRWKAVAPPDRWGLSSANLFVQEPGGSQAPFWLQAGMLERGLVPAWLEGMSGTCLDDLLAHENQAIRARRGHWAPRAQAARHRAISREPTQHFGRRMVAIWKVGEVKSWRALHFVNFVGIGRAGPSLSLSAKIAAHLKVDGKPVTDLRGQRMLVRFVVPGGGLSRIRIESAAQLGRLE